MNNAFKVNWWRWLSIIFLGIGIRFFLDVVFGLVYTNYQITWDFRDYGKAILLAFIVLEGLRWINRKLDKRFPWERNAVDRFFLQLFTNIAFVLVVMNGVRLYFIILFKQYQFINFDDEVVIGTVAVAVTFLVVVIELGIFFLQRWRYSLAELERFRKENLEFRFEMLKTQVNPHFLFNSLNTLSSLVFSDQDTAYRFIRKLAKVYRNVLDKRDKEVITLREEIDHLQAYLELIRMRFNEKLIINIELAEEKKDGYVAPMILQMLIENAIKHNIVSDRKPLSIDIYSVNGDIVVNNRLQKKLSSGYSSKIGLSNIRNHYDIITNKKVRIEETSTDFTVRVPILENVYEGFDN